MCHLGDGGRLFTVLDEWRARVRDAYSEKHEMDIGI